MNISFSKTIDQLLLYNKTVTRRFGWEKAHCGQILTAIEKGQGLKKGESVTPICEIQLLTPRWERVELMLTDQEYGEREVILEGFPDMTPKEFVEMLCDFNKKRPDELVHRLEFRYLLREKYTEFVTNDGTYVLKPDYFEYQPDGTLAGLFKDKPEDLNQMLLDTFRYEF